MMKRFSILALVLMMLVAAPQFEAMPTGIGAAGDNGAFLHVDGRVERSNILSV